MSRVMSVAFTSLPPPYAAILDLDRKLRDFYVPAHLRLQWADEESLDHPLLIKRWVVHSNKEWGKRFSLDFGVQGTESSCSAIKHPSRVLCASASRKSPRSSETSIWSVRHGALPFGVPARRRVHEDMSSVPAKFSILPHEFCKLQGAFRCCTFFHPSALPQKFSITSHADRDVFARVFGAQVKFSEACPGCAQQGSCFVRYWH